MTCLTRIKLLNYDISICSRINSRRNYSFNNNGVCNRLMIGQIHTNDELVEVSVKIIEMLESYNYAERYKILNSLLEGLKLTLGEQGYAIITKENKCQIKE